MKAIIYCRKSTDREDMQVQSLDDQLSFCRETAKTAGYEVIEEIVESISAKNPEKRPGFKKMVKMIGGGGADTIITWKVNRLARNPIDQGYIEWYLQEGKIKKIISNDGVFTCGDNVLIIRMYFGMATQYVIDMRKDIIRGMRSKIEKGGLIYKPPRGYSIVNGEAEVNGEAIVIKEIFSLRKKGYSMDDIAMKIYQKYNFSTKKGNKVPHTYIAKILENPFYYGALKWGEEIFNGRHTPLISKKEYDCINLSNTIPTSRASIHKKTTLMALRGHVREKGSGKLLTASLIKDKYIYFHNSNREAGKIYLNQQAIFDEFDKIVPFLNLNKEMEPLIKGAFSDLFKGKQKDVSDMRKQFKRREDELQKKKQGLLEMRMNKEIDGGEFIELKNKFTEELQDVKTQLLTLDTLDDEILSKVDTIIDFCTNLHQAYKTADFEGKIDIIKILSTNLFVDTEKNIFISLNPLYEAIYEANKNPLEVGKISVSTVWWTRRDSNPRP